MKKLLLLSCIIATIGASCLFLFASWKSNRVSSLEQYNAWLNDDAHKCLLKKSIGGVRISVKYQPPLYIAIKDAAHNSVPAEAKNKMLNDLLAQQDKVMTFMMTLGPDKDLPEQRRAAPLMSEGVNGYAQFSERVMSANFFMDQYINLYIDGVPHKAALCILENLYELSDERTFMVVFAPGDKEDITAGKQVVFEYNDPYFNMGKVQFDFSAADLQKARQIKVIKG